MRQINQNILKIKDPTTGEFKTLPNLMLDNSTKEISGVEVGTTEPTDTYTDVWIDTNEDVSYKIPQIDDVVVSADDTWSSQKISGEIENCYSENNQPPYPVTSVDGKTGAVSTAINYSTSEVNTGNTWIDGKPIYAIVIELAAGTGSTSGVRIDISHVDIDTMIVLRGMLSPKSSQTKTCFTIPDVAVSQLNLGVQIEWYKSEGNLFFATTRSWDGGFIYLEYTRTAD